MKINRWVILMLIFQLTSLYGQGVNTDATGLIKGEPGKLNLLIEQLHPDAVKIGLTREEILNRIKSKFSAYDISPKDPENRNEYLYINVNVGDPFYSIGIELRRNVYYIVNKKTYLTFGASTWQIGVSGSHGKGNEEILRSLDALMERFFEAYQEANIEK
jgi:hypothetical protein